MRPNSESWRCFSWDDDLALAQNARGHTGFEQRHQHRAAILVHAMQHRGGHRRAQQLQHRRGLVRILAVVVVKACVLENGYP